MNEYRAFLIDQFGKVTRREDFEAEDDVQAVQIAQKYVNGHRVEVWQASRVVGKMSRHFDASGTLHRRMCLASEGDQNA
jgi:hypothetical protein